MTWTQLLHKSLRLLIKPVSLKRWHQTRFGYFRTVALFQQWHKSKQFSDITQLCKKKNSPRSWNLLFILAKVLWFDSTIERNGIIDLFVHQLQQQSQCGNYFIRNTWALPKTDPCYPARLKFLSEASFYLHWYLREFVKIMLNYCESSSTHHTEPYCLKNTCMSYKTFLNLWHFPICWSTIAL